MNPEGIFQTDENIAFLAMSAAKTKTLTIVSPSPKKKKKPKEKKGFRSTIRKLLGAEQAKK